MPGQKISSLPLVTNLLAADEFPLSRSASTYKITGDKFASKAQLDSLSATVDVKFISLSSTVDRDFIKKPASASAQQVLTFNSSTSTWVASAAAPLLSAVDSSTIDLSYNSTTGVLSANVSVTPVGSVIAFPATSAPTGWLVLNGASLNRTDYPALWAYAQSSGNIVTEAVWAATNTGSFSTGNLSTTFRIPDLRGEFVRGWDNSRGVDIGRGIGVYQSDMFKEHAHTSTFFRDRSSGAYGNAVLGDENIYGTQDSTSQLTGGTETRPRNISLLHCIKF